jgi:putative transcriptional regulator
MSNSNFLTGQFLLSTPGMGDPRFRRSVIAMCAHSAEGAMGIGLTESADVSFRDILAQLKITASPAIDRPVGIGGPVDTKRGFILHSLDCCFSDTIDVAGRWGLSNSVEMLRRIAAGRGPRHWHLALGYAGWGAGQLENELTQNGWSIAPGNADWIFATERKERWVHAWRAQGIDPAALSGQFGSA